jgi:hypothetical protein
VTDVGTVPESWLSGLVSGVFGVTVGQLLEVARLVFDVSGFSVSVRHLRTRQKEQAQGKRIGPFPR